MGYRTGCRSLPINNACEILCYDSSCFAIQAKVCVCALQSAVDRLVKDKMPKKSGRWWFSWRRRDMDINQVTRA